ncbi:hypothetical protein SASPL_136297 [Salvia splendens]|uniref:Uncharacterized protein n=1 Tax=Salvia splendens TaxID=180675 RepID=A0A8X8X1F0_SALSN|nr:hypothetical protein SASPL_136297 [Salvia splendens]
MSGGLSGGSDGSFDADDLSEIRERFKELTKEKEMLRDSKSQGFELLRRLEFHVKTLSESREGDKKRIADLERELSNSIQEIGGRILFEITYKYTHEYAHRHTWTHLGIGVKLSYCQKRI